MSAPEPTLAFLVRASRELAAARTVFTGFHWPLLAARLARRLGRGRFGQMLEAGAVLHADPALLPTSTTDYAALEGAATWVGTTSDALQALVRRCDRVLLDAGNLDLAGRVNSTAIGPPARPRVRLPGSGGAADAAAAARELVLLHGGSDPRRLAAAVENVTARPRPGAPVRAIGPFGVLELGARPRLLERHGEDAAGFAERLRELGVELSGARPQPAPTEAEAEAANAVLAEAAERGYAVARRALGR